MPAVHISFVNRFASRRLPLSLAVSTVVPAWQCCHHFYQFIFFLVAPTLAVRQFSFQSSLLDIVSGQCIHCVSKKNIPDDFSYNSIKH